MSETQLSTDTLIVRRDELIAHLIEGNSYLTDERKESIGKEIARIAFELSCRDENA